MNLLENDLEVLDREEHARKSLVDRHAFELVDPHYPFPVPTGDHELVGKAPSVQMAVFHEVTSCQDDQKVAPAESAGNLLSLKDLENVDQVGENFLLVSFHVSQVAENQRDHVSDQVQCYLQIQEAFPSVLQLVFLQRSSTMILL